MHEGFFQLQSRPFPAAPVVANYFPSQSIESARQNLIRVIERAEGPGVVIGPAGVGKTLLLRVLAEHFGQVLKVVMLSGTRIATRKSLLQSILFELELPYRGMDEGELRLALIDALRRCDAIPRGILLLIDEAHILPLRLLDELRLITNVVHEGLPRVRLVLAGNPQLEERFTNPKLDSLNQRIAARCYLQAFSRDETNEYLRAEISWAGGDSDAIFSEDTARAVFRASDGIPRLINQVFDHALVMAQARQKERIDPEAIQEAWADLQQLPPPWSEPLATSAGMTRTVIEFGQLEDEEEPATSNASSQAKLPRDVDLCVAQNDCPCDDSPHLFEEFQSDTVLVNAPFMHESAEWTDGADQPTVQATAPQTEFDPFADTYDEEIVVIDRLTAKNCDGLRGRPRVSCEEGREIVEALAAIVKPKAAVRQQPVDNVACLVGDSTAIPAFEFSTLQDLPAIDFQDELHDEANMVGMEQAEHIEVDFEDEADCVPLPWTRGSLGDDRDIIVVEDDSPCEPTSDSETTTAGPRGREYRELFAQLRKVSS